MSRWIVLSAGGCAAHRPQPPRRDHHPFAYSIWLAGGGIRGGQVLGATDEIGWNVTENPVHVNDFHATTLRLFGLDHLKLTHRFQGRDFRLTDMGGKVVEQLIAWGSTPINRNPGRSQR